MFILITICSILMVSSIGCIGSDDDDEPDRYHNLSITLVPKDLAENGSENYTVILPFPLGDDDVFFYLNRSFVFPGLSHLEYYVHGKDQIRFEIGENVSFEIVCDYHKFVDKDDVYRDGSGPHKKFNIYYSGDYDSVEVYYFERFVRDTELIEAQKETTITSGWTEIKTEYKHRVD